MKGKIVPWFSARQINTVGDYARFFHTRTFLRQRSALFQDPQAVQGLMAAVGYKKALKFAQHRQAWDAMARDIPLKYLAAIGADLDILAAAAQADREEFEAAMALPFYPEWAIEREFTIIFRDIRFPDGVTEAEAVALLVERSKETKHPHCIRSPLKAIFIRPDGTIGVELFEPKFRISGSFLVLVGRDGRDIGTARLG